MKLSAPKYYKDFSCKADKCRHSCCVGWEIDIDERTLGRYASLPGEDGERIRKSISKDGGTPHFILTRGGACPHLDENGLCRIITKYGDSMISDICREHPRFYNLTKSGAEVGIGASCEEAARLILSSDGYADIEKIGETDAARDSFDFDPLPERAVIFSILGKRELAYEERLRRIETHFGVSPAKISDSDWRSTLSELEYLSLKNKELFSCYTSDFSYTGCEEELERALAYFVYRHCTGAGSEDEFKAALGFSLFSERLIASIKRKHQKADLSEILRCLSEELEYSEDNTERITEEFLFI